MNSLDSNVLVYAASNQDLEKQKAALKLIEKATSEGWPICAQVLGEFFSVATRRQFATRGEVRGFVLAWKAIMPPMVSSNEAHAAALDLATAHQLQYWDALIVATCAEHGVTQLYTEDLPGVSKPLGVKCVNPFK